MSQARRIKSKPASKKSAPKSRRILELPWGLICVVILSLSVLGFLFYGAKSGNREFGAGLAEIIENFRQQPETDPEIAELIENKSSKKEFDFYTLLPDIEKVMPDDLPEATPTRPTVNVDYYLQAASFRERKDAEKLRARFALKGYQSMTQSRIVADKGTYYRVRLGPYSDKRRAKTVKNKLQRLGVRPFIYTVKK